MTKICKRSQNQIDSSINLEGVELNKPRDDFTGGIPKQPEYRNPKLLEAVRQLPCVSCGKIGFTQAAHSNQSRHGKCGFKRKASDAAVMALCGGVGSNLCHESLDNGKMYKKAQRQELTDAWIADTYIQLVMRGFISGLDTQLADYQMAMNEKVADDFIKQMESGKVKVL